MSNTNFPEPNADLIAELQSALNELDLRLEEVPMPGFTPYLGVPVGDEPDPDGDRDWPGVSPCPNCNHQLELDADFRCLHCGSSH
jgi:hypothetical protein